jgi:hypothetical protein
MAMTASKVIEAIKLLPRDEQSQVVQFTMDVARSRQLSGDELAVLGQQLLDATDPSKQQRLRDEMTRGFYGD